MHCSWELPWGTSNPWFVVSAVLNGGRLELPAPDTPLPGPGPLPPAVMQAYVQLLQRCWAQEKLERPTFQAVVEALRSVAVFLVLLLADASCHGAMRSCCSAAGRRESWSISNFAVPWGLWRRRHACFVFVLCVCYRTM